MDDKKVEPQQTEQQLPLLPPPPPVGGPPLASTLPHFVHVVSILDRIIPCHRARRSLPLLTHPVDRSPLHSTHTCCTQPSLRVSYALRATLHHATPPERRAAASCAAGSETGTGLGGLGRLGAHRRAESVRRAAGRAGRHTPPADQSGGDDGGGGGGCCFRGFFAGGDSHWSKSGTSAVESRGRLAGAA